MAKSAYFFRVLKSVLSSGYQATPPEMLMCSSLPLGRMEALSCRAARSFSSSSRTASRLS